MNFDPVSRTGRRIRAMTGRKLLDSRELPLFLHRLVTPRLLDEIATFASKVFREEAARESLHVDGWSVEIWDPDKIALTQQVVLLLVGPDRIGYTIDPREVMAEQRAESAFE